MFDSALVWFRRDLRDRDNTALSEALRRARRVFCVFVFDKTILDKLNNTADRRVDFIHRTLVELDASLRRRGGGLIVKHATASDEIPRLAADLKVNAVFVNRDYEPAAKARDACVAERLAQIGISLEDYKDHVVFDRAEVLSPKGSPYRAFTPYYKAWLRRLSEADLSGYDLPNGRLVASADHAGIPTLTQIGFATTDLGRLGVIAGMSGAQALAHRFSQLIGRYDELRDYPHADAGSRLSVHLRFGTISIRQLVSTALTLGAREAEFGAAKWLAELVWREFYCMILDWFPQVTSQSFKPEFDRIRWEIGAHAEANFALWCDGKTGYPFVDAAMRQLKATGYLHNRARMVVASFLTKDLGIDWRKGEAFFAEHLLDFDTAANNGGWQWSASSGCDAQPYFRIFNPVKQSMRFDPGGLFIRHYLPELCNVPDRFIHAPWLMSCSEQDSSGVIVGRDTPSPLVDHDTARRQALERYSVVRRAGSS